MNIAALVSGGVDSSVTVHLLKEQGYNPTIFYIKIGLEDEPGFVSCPSDEDIEIVQYIARKYGCRLEIVSLQEEYWERVVDYTIRSVRQGLTPNPDVMCNKLIKFGSFEEKYGTAFDAITTGHYAGIVEKGGYRYLGTAKDRTKDQTYFLGQINNVQLGKMMFPLSGLLKKEVREIAEYAKLPSAGRPDSQGICFLGKINYNEFIRRYVGEKKGKIVEWETGKVLGEHKGYWFHTIGQRKGLGLSQGPWIVAKKGIAENTIYVSHGYDPVNIYRNRVYLDGFQLIGGPPETDLHASEIAFKIRHTPEFSMGKLIMEDGKCFIQAEQPVPGVAPGQYGVIYDRDCTICLGSGMISEENN